MSQLSRRTDIWIRSETQQKLLDANSFSESELYDIHNDSAHIDQDELTQYALLRGFFLSSWKLHLSCQTSLEGKSLHCLQLTVSLNRILCTLTKPVTVCTLVFIPLIVYLFIPASRPDEATKDATTSGNCQHFFVDMRSASGVFFCVYIFSNPSWSWQKDAHTTPGSDG